MSNDLAYLQKLQDRYARHKALPSYSQIGELVGMSSKASVAKLVLRLKGEGYLASLPGGRLKPGRKFFDRTVHDSVRAGFPSPAEDGLRDVITIDDYLIEHPSKTVIVRVKGDSMIDAGIHNGDLAIVERRPSADFGQIVVAIVDNEFTIKYLHREKGRPCLKPANKAYPMIHPAGELEIFGVVVGVVRKYD